MRSIKEFDVPNLENLEDSKLINLAQIETVEWDGTHPATNDDRYADCQIYKVTFASGRHCHVVLDSLESSYLDAFNAERTLWHTIEKPTTSTSRPSET